VKTLLWRRLDEPGMEIARVDSLGRASGTQIGLTYELRWHLDGARLDLEVVGDRRKTVELGGNGVVRYSSGSFTADIEFDADGFVTLYHGFLERLS
jgi:hypothetical protein